MPGMGAETSVCVFNYLTSWLPKEKNTRGRRWWRARGNVGSSLTLGHVPFTLLSNRGALTLTSHWRLKIFHPKSAGGEPLQGGSYQNFGARGRGNRECNEDRSL